VPFRDVYIHALVRDADRQKMSKTKGNVIDPVEIVKKYGTDAVRFTLASMASPGTDIAFSEARTEGYRAFANKIWNAARFLFMNVERAREAGIEVDLSDLRSHLSAKQFSDQAFANRAARACMPCAEDPSCLEARWIVYQLHVTAQTVRTALHGYRFDEAANLIYQFFWRDFCDWYLEVVKLRLDFSSPDIAKSALSTLVRIFEACLRLLSPFMPFITEEIWQALYGNDAPARSIALTWYPEANGKVIGAEFQRGTEREFRALQEVITTTRSARKELGVPEKEFVPVHIYQGAQLLMRDSDTERLFKHFAKVSEIIYLSSPPPPKFEGGYSRSSFSFDLAIIYRKPVDTAAERERLTKDLAKQEKVLASSENQLNNPAFLAKAPGNVVEGLRKQESDTRLMIEKTRRALEELG
jgi:valyl-tRNA synthetase